MSAGMRWSIGKAALEEVLAATGVKVTPEDAEAVGRSLLRIEAAATTLLQSLPFDETAERFLSASRNRRGQGDRQVNDPTALTLREAAAAIAQGRLRSEALVEACLDRIARLQPILNCFIRVTAEAAREQARAADRAVKAGQAIGPLHGVPLAHKDMFYRAGEVCTCGSKIRADFVPDHTATVLTRFDAAGSIELGRLNMAEFALGPTGHNEHYGRCRNPWNPDYITGGSSSGSGAAVAAGLAFGALGSDTGGSVRLPAAACGVVGIKPTFGRVSRYGTMPLSHSLRLHRRARPHRRRLRAALVGDGGRRTSATACRAAHTVPDYERGLDDANRRARSRE